MFNSIIPKLYEMCQNDEFKGIKALQFDDLKIAYEYLNVFEKQHNISTADHNRLTFVLTISAPIFIWGRKKYLWKNPLLR